MQDCEWYAVTIGFEDVPNTKSTTSTSAESSITQRIGSLEALDLDAVSSISQSEEEQNSYVLLSKWSKDHTSFDLWITDGLSCWRGRDLKRPKCATHNKWNETAFEALTQKKFHISGEDDREDKTSQSLAMPKVNIHKSQSHSGKGLRVSWTWKEHIDTTTATTTTRTADAIIMKGWIEEKEMCPYATAYATKQAIGHILAKLVEAQNLLVNATYKSNAVTDEFKTKYVQTRQRFDEYKRSENERTTLILRKCAALLNAKKEKIRQLEGEKRGSIAPAEPRQLTSETSKVSNAVAAIAAPAAAAQQKRKLNAEASSTAIGGAAIVQRKHARRRL